MRIARVGDFFLSVPAKNFPLDQKKTEKTEIYPEKILEKRKFYVIFSWKNGKTE